MTHQRNEEFDLLRILVEDQAQQAVGTLLSLSYPLQTGNLLTGGHSGIHGSKAVPAFCPE
jgi:hypothetical protein